MKSKPILQVFLKYAVYLILVILISFFLPRLIPGSPLNYFIGEGTGYDNVIPSSVLGPFEQYYAPNLPIAQQFFRYIGNLLALDLGLSFYYKTPVMDCILGAARWTLQLSLLSLALSTLLGVLMGVGIGMMKSRHGGRLITPLLATQSLPTFLVATVMQILLAYRLRLFPATGAVTPGMLVGQPGYFADMVEHMILPLLILVFCEAPSVAIFTYNSTLKIKKQPYVAFAHYLNVQPRQIRWQFVVKNILPDIMGKLNIQAVMCIMGSMFVEAVFSYPGLGQLMKNATNTRDYPLMQGVLLVSCVYGILVNMIFELLLTHNIKKS